MRHIIIQMISGVGGALGFGLIFNLDKKHIPFAILGGFLCWTVYLVCEHFGIGVFFSTLAASAASTIYAEGMARVRKAPATLFLVPPLLILAPGASLYYTMSYGVANDWEMSRLYGSLTIQYALGMAAGMSFVWAAGDMIRRILAGKKVKR